MSSTLVTGLIYIVTLPVIVWMAGAIYFDAARGSRRGACLAVVWLALATAAFTLWAPLWKPLATLAIVSGIFLGWWFSQRPSHHRDWNANFARLPRVTMAGDVATIENVRNTEYRSIDDCTPRFETRNYRLSHLRGVDVLISFWGSKWMCHPMFVFDFGPDGRVCISIEVRYRVGQKFSLLRSLYRQQELMYVVCDERDAILRRTKHQRGHDVYLYRLHADALAMRQFFLEYAASINSLAAHPRWYHGLTTNCTTSIYSQGRGHIQWDWRLVFNGALDRLMYDRQLLDPDLPFEELKQQSWINDVANSATADGFGDYIRRELPSYRQRIERDCGVTEQHGSHLS